MPSLLIILIRIKTHRKGARVVESAGLENRNSLLAIEGSNPSPSAKKTQALGEVQEWLNWHAWRACVRVTVPWVRIPPSPLSRTDTHKNPHQGVP